MEKRVNVLTIVDQLIPSNIIGVIKPMLELQKTGDVFFHMRYTFNYKESDIAGCDVVILCRNMRSTDLKILELIKKHNKRLIYDIDDNFFDISIMTPIGKYHRHPIHLYVVSKMIEFADVVRVYSRPMESIAQKLNKNTYLLKSYFDFELIKGLEKTTKNKIRIVYATSRGMDDTLTSIFMPAIVRILEEYGEQIEFCVFGSVPIQLGNFNNIKKLPYEANYNKFIKYFYKQGFDIGIAPLLDDTFHRSKTNNKFREYGAMGVCGIYSKSEIYNDCVVDGENGLLIENTTENWYASLKKLIDNEDLREKISSNAYDTVKNNYSIESIIEDWRKLIRTKTSEPLKTFNNILKLKILIIFENQEDIASQVRWTPLNILLYSINIEYKVISKDHINPALLKYYDLIVLFAVNPDKIDLLIDDIEKYTLNIVIDCIEEVHPVKQNIIYTSPVCKNTANTLQIKSQSYNDFNDLLSSLYTNMLFHNGQAGIVDVAKYVQDKKEELCEEYFSINSPVFIWASLLEKYEGTSESVKHAILYIKMMHVFKKLFRPLTYVRNKLRKLYSFFSNYFSKGKLLLRMEVDYIKINIRKNY